MKPSTRALLHSTLLSAVATASAMSAGCEPMVGRSTFNFGGRPVEWWNAKSLPGVTYLALREAPDDSARFGGDMGPRGRGAISHERGGACQALESSCPYVVREDPSRRTDARPANDAGGEPTTAASAVCAALEAGCPSAVRVALASASPGRSALVLRDGVTVVVTAANFAEVFGAVDSEEKAVLRVWLDGKSVEASFQSERARSIGAQARRVEGGFEVWAEIETRDCSVGTGTTDHMLVFVAPDGSLTPRESHVMEQIREQCHPLGRRPEGFAGAAPSASADPVARYFARAAQLEGAAIAAFERLACELDRFGAPDALRQRAVAGAHDERAHCASMSAWYEAYAGAPADPRWLRSEAPRDERTLEALAIENAVEGCVLECFAAAIALYQAERAADPALRRAFARIAAEEVEHGALAWDIHRWALEVLDDDDARARVIAALNEATRKLCAHVATSWFVDDAQVWAGEPHASGALHLARVVEALSEHVAGNALHVANGLPS